MLVFALASLSGGNKGSQRVHLTERACALHNLPIERNNLGPFYQTCLMLWAHVPWTGSRLAPFSFRAHRTTAFLINHAATPLSLGSPELLDVTPTP